MYSCTNCVVHISIMRMGCVRANTLAFCVKSAVFFVNPSVFCVIPSVFCVISPRNSLTLCEIGTFSCGFVRFLRQFARADDQYLGESTVDLDEFRLNFARIPVEVRPYMYKIQMAFNVNCPWNSLEFTVNSFTDLAAG